MSQSSKPYKLLISGILVQKTAFSTGGNRYETGDNNDIDNLLAKDGEGRYTLRGTSLAGAFLATAQQICMELPNTLSEDSPKEQESRLKTAFDNRVDKEQDYKQWLQKQPRMNESVWIFHHAHPINTPQNEVRDNVAINQQTGAAQHSAKFDSEILPAGTRWQFLMEVDEYRDQNNNASAIALRVIEQWEEKQCWLGRDVARGLGWMTLQNTKVYRLSSEQATIWPDAHKTPCELLQGLHRYQLPKEAITEIKKEVHAKPACAIGGTITITVGKNNDGYGLDMLSVGGHQKERDGKQRKTNQPDKLMGKQFLQKHKNKLLAPQGIERDEYVKFKESNTGDADFSLSVTCTADGKTIPIIPGSSIRGSLRHVLSWLLRKQGNTIWSPSDTDTPPDDNDIVHKLFGSTSQSAKLLISDAMLQDGADWQAVVLEMHAEDEFTQGVYGSGKFDRTCLTRGIFEAVVMMS